MSYFSLPNMIDIDIALHPKELESCVEGMKQKRLKKGVNVGNILELGLLVNNFHHFGQFRGKKFLQKAQLLRLRGASV